MDFGRTGISGKSQVLFAIVYTTRYLDLVTTYISAYNSVMKVVFLAASYGTLYLMYMKFKATYDHNHDTFRYIWGDLNFESGLDFYGLDTLRLIVISWYFVMRSIRVLNFEIQMFWNYRNKFLYCIKFINCLKLVQMIFVYNY